MVKHITQMRKYIYIIYMAENKYKTITYIIHKLKIVRHKKSAPTFKIM